MSHRKGVYVYVLCVMYVYVYVYVYVFVFGRPHMSVFTHPVSFKHPRPSAI